MIGPCGPDPGVGVNALYDADYFAHSLGEPYQRDNPRWQAFFARLADRIIAELAPHTVLDVGCAMGMLVEALRDRGLDARGFDVSEFGLSQVRDDVRAFCWRQSVTDDFTGTYDLITCIEVLEHLPPGEAPAVVERLTRHTDRVLFSSTPTDFDELTHLNVRPPDYWAGLFALHSFFRDVDVDTSYVAPQCVLFRRIEGPIAPVIRGYERWLWSLSTENRALRAARLADRALQANRTHDRGGPPLTLGGKLGLRLDWCIAQLIKLTPASWSTHR